MARRLVALAVALLLVAGALAIRNRIDDDSDGNGSSGNSSGPVALTCASELAAVCDALASADRSVTVTIEPAGVTAARLQRATGDVNGLDGWLVEAPWPVIVDEARARNGTPALFDTTSDVLARSPLVLAMWNDRLAAIETQCEEGALTWKCIGDVAGRAWSSVGGEPNWGGVKPGVASPVSDGIGALVAAQATVSFFGTTDLSSTDFADDAFLRWITQLATAVPQNPTFDDMLTFGPSAVDVVGTTEAEAGPGLEISRDKGRITITYPAPMATADVVLASVVGAPGAQRLAQIVGGDAGLDALAASGWRVPNRPSPAGVKPEVEMPDSSGLPSPGAIDALRGVWQAAR